MGEHGAGTHLGRNRRSCCPLGGKPRWECEGCGCRLRKEDKGTNKGVSKRVPCVTTYIVIVQGLGQEQLTFKTLFERLFDDGRDPKVLFHKEFGADLELIKLSNRGRSAEPAGEDIVLGVVRDHVLGDTVDNDGHGLLDEAVLLESVRVGK